MTKSVTLRRCASLEEAVVIASFLQANDIPAEVADRNMMQNEWMMNMALGGRVVVPDAFEARAEELLSQAETSMEEVPEDELVTAAEEVSEPLGRKDRWKVWSIVLFGMNLIVLPAMLAFIAIEKLRRGKSTPVLPESPAE